MKAIEGLFQKIEPLQHPERTDGRTHATEIITLPAKAGGKYNLICIYLILSHIQKCMEVYNYFVLT